jgi:hypothetical protein
MPSKSIQNKNHLPIASGTAQFGVWTMYKLTRTMPDSYLIQDQYVPYLASRRAHTGRCIASTRRADASEPREEKSNVDHATSSDSERRERRAAGCARRKALVLVLSRTYTTVARVGWPISTCCWRNRCISIFLLVWILGCV